MKSNFENFLEDFFPELIPMYQNLAYPHATHYSFHPATDILMQTLSGQEMIDYLERTESNGERTIKHIHNDFIKLSECFFEYRDRGPLDEGFPDWTYLAEWNLKEIWWDKNGFLKDDFNPSEEKFIIRDSSIPILELSLEYDRILNHYGDVAGFFDLFKIHTLSHQDINDIPSYLIELDTFLAIPNSINDIPDWNDDDFEDYLRDIEPRGPDLEYFSRMDEAINFLSEAKFQEIRNNEPEKLLFFDLYSEDAILSDSYIKEAYNELEKNRFYCSFIESYFPGGFYLDP